MDFQNNPPFERSACFHVTISENLKRFQQSTLKQIFQKTETFFKKLEFVFQLKALRLKTHHFHTKLPYQKPILRQIKWWLKKWTHHKEGSFASNYFNFLKILFQFKNLIYRVEFWYQQSKCPYLYFLQALEFHLKVLFLCEYP